MKLLLLGATGGTGAALLTQATAAGHNVTVITRRPENIHFAELARVTIVQGDVLERGPWSEAAAEDNTAVSCLGSTDRKHPTTIYSRGTLNVLNAMESGPTRRLICLSSAGLYIPGDTPLARKIVTRVIVQRMYRHGYVDMRRMEAALHEQDARWTVVRPPMLTDKPPTGDYRTAVDSHLLNSRSIPRADLAHYLLASIDDPATVNKVVEIST